MGCAHRAGIGASEHSDAVVAIVSEETGSISVAVGGMLKRHLAPETLERLLRNELLPEAEPQGGSRNSNSPICSRPGRESRRMWKKIADSRWFYVVVSVLLAFILWLYVGNEANPTQSATLRGIKVNFSGLEKLEERGLMISEGESQTMTLSLWARGMCSIS